MKKFEDYYLGLDLGTTSLGWAVSNERYEIPKFNGKFMWGTRLFNEAKTAEERRVFRSSRRRLKRRKERLKLLQMLFSEEVSKVDIGFFQRLADSKYYKEDKKINQTNSLFFDKDYSDKDYFKDFPTIYHLRKYLLEGNKPKDVRILFLALQHFLKHRGHFLFPDMNLENVTSFSVVFNSLKNYFFEEFELELEWENGSIAEVEKILKSSDIPKSEKEKKLCGLILSNSEKIDSQRKAIIGLMCGCKKKFNDIFDTKDYSEAEIISISFDEFNFDENKDKLEEILGEKTIGIDYIKSIYDWAKLSIILKDEKSISSAKVKSYEIHQRELKDLKYILGKYDSKEKRNVFKNKDEKSNNYLNYIESKVTQEELNKNILKILEKIETKVEKKDEDIFNILIKKAKNNDLFNRQHIKDNGLIPYQVHRYELEKILENMEKYFEFLKFKKDGTTISEKIKAIFEFRIPYYVGPLNDTHEKAWIVKEKGVKIYPWNFEKVVDLEASAEKFIQNLTNKCTYLPLEDVLPKNSLLYSKFMVLNELNNLKRDGENIPVDLKQKIYKDLFQTQKKVTLKKLKAYLKSENIEITENTQITGIDGDFKSSLGSFIDFYKIIGEDILKDSGKKLVEDCIRWITLYNGEKKFLEKRIKEKYSETLDEENIKKISKLKYKDWGRLSYKLLKEVQAPNIESGELRNIIQMMWETNYNFMELLNLNSDLKISFLDEINKINSNDESKVEINYNSLLKDTYLSPPVKRMAWQTIKLVEEIKKITKKEPKKLFIEMARSKDEKKERRESRKNNLIQFYKAIKGEERDWVQELEGKSEADFRIKKLYLYYTQMGKCMYSGEAIPLDNLFNKNIYDIDHIYPRSKTKDDSIENLVLVKKNINAKKTDEYPIIPDIQNKMIVFWQSLKKNNLIGNKKFERLTRKDSFSIDELSGFIARQLVETRQATKAVADILSKVLPNSKIVYVKANLTSDFRRMFNFVKSRDINDFHHAHDAYLNIVTGNVYNKKFTNNPRNFIIEQRKKNKDYRYNLKVENIFSDAEWNKKYWNPKFTIPLIEKYIYKKKPLFTRHSFEQHGGFFDQNIVNKIDVAKGKGYLAIKSSDEKLLNTLKYGGYNKVAGAYFFLVEHTQKNKRIRTIETLPLYLINQLNVKEKLEEYCKENLNLIEPNIRLERIKYQSLLKINGYLYNIMSKSKDDYFIKGTIQFLPTKNLYEYIRKLYKTLEKNKTYKNQNFILDEKKDEKENLKITKENNQKLYQYILEKFENSIYINKRGNITYKANASKINENISFENNISSLLKNYKEDFINLDLEKQINVLTEILKFLQAKNEGVDLSIFSLAKKAGITKFNKNIEKLNEIILINQSISGLFENFIDLKKV